MTQLLSHTPAPGQPWPSLNRRLRLGIVGGGRIAVTQTMAARMTGYWEVCAGALSSDPATSIERGKKWHLDAGRCYAGFNAMATEEAARADGIDAVMITAPNHVHHAAAKAFLSAGIPVLCDKPLTNEVTEADDLVTMVEEQGSVFAVGFVMSCFPMVRLAREIVAQGNLGDLCQIHSEFFQDFMIPDDVGQAPHIKWRLDPAKSGKTSCTADIGTHAHHLSDFVSGTAMTHVRAEMHVCGAPKPLEDTVFMGTRHEAEIPGTLMATRLAAGHRGHLQLRIFGRKGSLTWNLETCDQLKVSIFGKPDQVYSRGYGHGVSPTVEALVRTGRGFPEGIIEAWANFYSEFALAVASKSDGEVLPEGLINMPGVAEGARGVRFADAAFASHQEGGSWKSIS